MFYPPAVYFDSPLSAYGFCPNSDMVYALVSVDDSSQPWLIIMIILWAQSHRSKDMKQHNTASRDKYSKRIVKPSELLSLL